MEARDPPLEARDPPPQPDDAARAEPRRSARSRPTKRTFSPSKVCTRPAPRPMQPCVTAGRSLSGFRTGPRPTPERMIPSSLACICCCIAHPWALLTESPLASGRPAARYDLSMRLKRQKWQEERLAWEERLAAAESGYEAAVAEAAAVLTYEDITKSLSRRMPAESSAPCART